MAAYDSMLLSKYCLKRWTAIQLASVPLSPSVLRSNFSGIQISSASCTRTEVDSKINKLFLLSSLSDTDFCDDHVPAYPAGKYQKEDFVSVHIKEVELTSALRPLALEQEDYSGLREDVAGPLKEAAAAEQIMMRLGDIDAITSSR